MENADVGSACAAAQKRRFSASNSPAQDTVVKPSPPETAPEQPQTKQRRKGEPQLPEEWFSDCNLMELCDEVLYEIFKYLDTPSIMAVMHCSPRLENLLLDHRFWHRIDLSNGPLPMGILEEILGRATEKTHTVKICGPPSSQHVAGEGRQFTLTLNSVFPKVATQLKVLELQGVSLDFEYIHISEFPSSLKRLLLKDCSVKVGNMVKSIFHTIEMQLVDLEDLGIEDNDWFEPYYIMALSKLPSLRRLSLKGCQMLCKFVPYGSMAARFGFQKLEVLDLRLTPINNSDLQCFSAIENLKELRLESPPNMTTEPPNAQKANNGNVNDEAAPSQPEPLKVLNDDEPSTSRAALEHMRAAKIAQNREQAEAEVANCENSNEKKDQAPSSAPSPAPAASSSREPLAKRISGYLESEDEDTSSTSASSSDKSESATSQSNGQNGEAPVRPPLVVLELPGMGARLVRPEQPEQPAADADNAENPEAAGQDARPLPRAYIYVPEADPVGGENPHPPRNLVSLLDQVADHLRNWRGNNPAHSHFMPRRDQVIYMNPQGAREHMVLMHTRRHRTQQRGNIDQVVNHPMFWNMLDPLDREYARRVRHRPPPCTTPPQYYVSDRAIYSFGRAARPVEPDVVWIRHINRSPNNRLERLSLRNYHHITNHTLEHLVQCSPNLVYIDVSGTSITLSGLRRFKSSKPECEVVATHLTPDDKNDEGDEIIVSGDESPDDKNDNQPPQSPPPPPELAAP
ncbi:uncharacterized protein Dana_GF18683 [Drosophila ananassae]|uniref:F-box domain-containing protein n=1 Tax=Drosophila ananassae TaxID=7217 RepID=B3LX13_DROAN|nr:uncharacterized protein LOC6501454 [Drosophila ananassae]EDV43852.2 uncharacterized protein Dana_GF18683 [Drosophila ananassae]